MSKESWAAVGQNGDHSVKYPIILKTMREENKGEGKKTYLRWLGRRLMKTYHWLVDSMKEPV